ncbi:hypothetical protein RADP37_05438 (plasmid) [Roseomonas mucosa]|uniref:Uncharacterized protein n=1 Tax=Roseomonas mucosa TaxID=207340 RepID=A0A4Y1MPR9_9PROT|nr:hypothetical protein RADP37_05438 [Roseomonas mucosa]
MTAKIRKNKALGGFGRGSSHKDCRATTLQSPHTTTDTGIKPCNPREELAQPRPMATPRSGFEDRPRFKFESSFTGGGWGRGSSCFVRTGGQDTKVLPASGL